jgi:hypothetical protein
MSIFRKLVIKVKLFACFMFIVYMQKIILLYYSRYVSGRGGGGGGLKPIFEIFLKQHL